MCLPNTITYQSECLCQLDATNNELKQEALRHETAKTPIRDIGGGAALVRDIGSIARNQRSASAFCAGISRDALPQPPWTSTCDSDGRLLSGDTNKNVPHLHPSSRVCVVGMFTIYTSIGALHAVMTLQHAI